MRNLRQEQGRSGKKLIEGEGRDSSPFLLDEIYKWLDIALDSGIPEKEFWDMTIAEVNRAVASHTRREKAKAQEKAIMDYKLANLIAAFLNDGKAPNVIKWYSFLFDEEVKAAVEQEEREAASEAAFINFTASFNQRFHSENTAKEVVDE